MKRKSTEVTLVKTMTPKDPDTKYFGNEPMFNSQPDDNSRVSEVARGLTWYNRFYSRKEAKEQMVEFLDATDRVAEAKVMRKVDEGEFRIPTYAWLARMTRRGLTLTEHELSKLENEISRLTTTVTAPVAKQISTLTTEKVVTNKPNVQETMREKARDAAGELEGILDEYVAAGCPTKHQLKPIDALAKNSVLPHHVTFIIELWRRKEAEINEVLSGKDRQLVEAYSYLGKQQLKNLSKFIEYVITSLNGYVSVKKTTRAPRARKVVPVEKLVSKLKYLKAYKDATMKLDLVSVHPSKLHGASEAWVFDTAKRKAYHFIADEYSKTFSVKGNTLLGFDVAKSQVKTLRKPGEQLKELMGSKPAARKFFDGIRAVATSPNGRFNENMIILKAW